MDTIKKLLDPEFVNAFNCRLNADVIDLDDMDYVLSSAGIVVLDLFEIGWTPDQVLRPLEAALANWGPEVLDEFSDANNGNWSFSAQAEDELRAIVNTMIKTARNGRLPAREAAE